MSQIVYQNLYCLLKYEHFKVIYTVIFNKSVPWQLCPNWDLAAPTRSLPFPCHLKFTWVASDLTWPHHFGLSLPGCLFPSDFSDPTFLTLQNTWPAHLGFPILICVATSQCLYVPLTFLFCWNSPISNFVWKPNIFLKILFFEILQVFFASLFIIHVQEHSADYSMVYCNFNPTV